MKINVLIADDHKLVRDGLRLILESSGAFHVVAEANDGLEAILHCRTHHPDVILMDIAMPSLNGIAATARITGEMPETRILMLSMQSTMEDIYQSLKAGACGFLVKESAGDDVVRAIKAAHAGKRYFSRILDDVSIDSYCFSRQARQVVTPVDSLSQRECEVLKLVADGRTSLEIAELLFLSAKTVETYRSRIMQKLGVHDIPALVKFAVRHGLTSL